MKKFLVTIVSVILPIICSAQAQINTKKVKISDFTEKVTKVVLSGSAFYDSAFQEEVSTRWRVSPYEFCTLEEFETLKTDDNYYFLILTDGQFKKEVEPGLRFLSLIKGGPDAEMGLDKMLEIITLPFSAYEMPTGRELAFLPAILDIIQDYTLESMKKDIYLLGGINSYTSNISKTGEMNIVFAEEDLSSDITESVIHSEFDSAIFVTDADNADAFMEDNTPNTLVSLTVVPTDPVNGSFCYKMLIGAQDHKIYYFRKHRISKRLGPGFLMEDIRRITAPRFKSK